DGGRLTRDGGTVGAAEVEHQLVGKAPAPVFAGLERSHDRMLGVMKVLGRVLVLRRITAAHVPALHAQAKVHPSVVHLEALFAAVCAWADFANLTEMCAAHDRESSSG